MTSVAVREVVPTQGDLLVIANGTTVWVKEVAGYRVRKAPNGTSWYVIDEGDTLLYSSTFKRKRYVHERGVGPTVESCKRQLDELEEQCNIT